MKRLRRSTAVASLLLASALALSACSRCGGARTSDGTDIRSLFEPLSPREDLHPGKVALGNRLFHEPALAADRGVPCSSCHDLTAGGDDGRVVGLGIRDTPGRSNPPTALNASLQFAFGWDGASATLGEQILAHVSDMRVLATSPDDIAGTLRQSPGYIVAFDAIYPDGANFENAVDALATFVRSLVFPGRFDAWLEGDESALTRRELAGLRRFVEVGCANCHNGPLLGGNSFQKLGAVEDYFAVRGGELTEADLGRFNVTGLGADDYVFKVPTLRDVARTAPYFHDGSVAELPDAVRRMARVQLGVSLSDRDVVAITAFLEALDSPVPDGLPLEPLLGSPEPPPAPGNAGGAPGLGSGAPSGD